MRQIMIYLAGTLGYLSWVSPYTTTRSEHDEDIFVPASLQPHAGAMYVCPTISSPLRQHT